MPQRAASDVASSRDAPLADSPVTAGSCVSGASRRVGRVLACCCVALVLLSLPAGLALGETGGDTGGVAVPERQVAMGLVPGAPILGAPILGAPIPGSDRAESLALDYDIYLGGLRMLTGVARMAVEDGRYAIQVDGRLTGMAAWFSDWAFAASSRGAVETGGADHGVRPAAHRSERMRRNRDRTVVMDFAPDGGIAVQVAPDAGDADRVPPAERAGALDPISAAMVVMTRMAEGGGCSLALPVYDGRRVYEAVFEALGPVELAASRYNAYAGPAQRCRMILRPRDGGGSAPGAAGRDEVSDIVVWLAAVEPGGVPVPVRLEARRSGGSAIMHLSAVHRSADPPRPPEVTGQPGRY